MSLSLRIAGASFTKFVTSLTLPDRTGLLGEYLFGGDYATSRINRAGGGAPSLTNIGTALYGENFAEIKSTGVGFTMGIDCPLDATMIVVVRRDTGMPPWMANLSSNYNGFLNFNSVPSVYNSQSGTLASVADLPAPTHNDYAFFAARMPGGGLGQIYGYTGGVLASATAEVAGVGRGTGTLQIGGSIPNAGAGVAKIAYAALFSRVMTEAQIAAAYASLKPYLATRGVTVS